MLIIVEGPDCSGKTTLIKDLEANILRQFPREQITMLHKGPPKEHPLDEYVMPLLNYRPCENKTIICDRWHLGEAIYPQIFDRPTQWYTGMRRYIEMFLQSRGALMTHTGVSLATLRHRLVNRGDDMVSDHQLGAIHSAYTHAFQTSFMPVEPVKQKVRLDFSVANIVERARTLEHQAIPLAKFKTYIGVSRPEIVLFGDVRNDKTNKLRPAFMPYPATSGDFLFHHAWGAGWRRTGVMNANDDDDIVEAIAMLRPQKLVALGRNAYDRLDRMGFRGGHVGSVPHPQYIRRFFHRHGTAYASALLDSMINGKDQLTWRPSSRS